MYGYCVSRLQISDLHSLVADLFSFEININLTVQGINRFNNTHISVKDILIVIIPRLDYLISFPKQKRTHDLGGTVWVECIP